MGIFYVFKNKLNMYKVSVANIFRKLSPTVSKNSTNYFNTDTNLRSLGVAFSLMAF